MINTYWNSDKMQDTFYTFITFIDGGGKKKNRTDTIKQKALNPPSPINKYT